jgi:hypothetical protein
MAKSVLAELVTKMTVESSQFKKELERTTGKTVKFGKEQKKAANDAVFSNKKMSNAFRQAAQSASALQGPMGGVSSRLSVLASGFSSVGIVATAAGIAISAVGVVAGLAVGKFAALEKRLFRTEALFKTTSGAAGLTTRELADLADEVAENTLASVVGVTQAINVLQTFKSISGDTFTRTVELSQDLAAVMGTDVKNASLQLGKALQDPILGLNSLRRSGVSFSDSQKAVIKSLVDTGRTAEAQEMILDSLESQVGGTGKSESGGLSGATDLLGQRWDELLETFALTTGIGASTTSALNSISGGLAGITGAMGDTDKLDELVNKLAELNSQTNLYIGRNLAPHLARKAAIQAQIDVINEKEALEREIIAQGAIEKEKLQAEADAARLKRQEETGLKQFNAIRKQTSGEIERIVDGWNERNAIIGALVLSEVAIREKGYESLIELQEAYYLKSGELGREDLAAAEAKAAARVASETKASDAIGMALLGNGAALAGQIAAMSEEGSKASKAAFFAQQAIAIATTIMNTEMAAIAALAPPPMGLGPIAGAPYALGIRLIGYTSAALIGAQTIAGARELGGPVMGGKSYLVGEKGPELFTPQATGQITNNQNLQKVTGQQAGGVTHVTINASGGGSQSYWNQQAKMITRAIAREERR